MFCTKVLRNQSPNDYKIIYILLWWIVSKRVALLDDVHKDDFDFDIVFFLYGCFAPKNGNFLRQMEMYQETCRVVYLSLCLLGLQEISLFHLFLVCYFLFIIIYYRLFPLHILLHPLKQCCCSHKLCNYFENKFGTRDKAWLVGWV